MLTIRAGVIRCTALIEVSTRPHISRNAASPVSMLRSKSWSRRCQSSRRVNDTPSHRGIDTNPANTPIIETVNRKGVNASISVATIPMQPRTPATLATSGLVGDSGIARHFRQDLINTVFEIGDPIAQSTLVSRLQADLDPAATNSDGKYDRKHSCAADVQR